MAKVKKNLSLEEEVLKRGLARAKELGYNFSSYVTYLINADTNINNFTAVTLEETSKKEINNAIAEEEKIDADILEEIDNIDNNF